MANLVNLIEGHDFSWEGKTLRGRSPEGIQAITAVMARHDWPFLPELCSWAEGSPVNGALVVFSGTFKDIDGAQTTLSRYAPRAPKE